MVVLLVHELSSDKFTFSKGIYLSILSLMTIFLLFNLVNIVQNQFLATVYVFLYLFSVIHFLFDYHPKFKGWFDTITIEPRSDRPLGLRNLPRWVDLTLIVAIVGFTLFQTSQSKLSIIASPSFQSLPTSIIGNPYFLAGISFIVGAIEHLFFFAVVLGLIYSVSRRMNIPPTFAVILTIFLTTGVFTMFHFFVYGTAEQAAFTATFVFGFANSLLAIFLRDQTIGTIWHGSNNFFVSLFKTVSIGI